MSVIFGKFNFGQKPVDSSELAKMQDALDHWSPDGKGNWIESTVGLGQLMLHNTPESLNEHLPFHETISGLVITADARLDNRDELFHKLDLPSTNSGLIPDSTLILKAYQKYSSGCVEHLIGDFAFAIWDCRGQQLFCARDHMGVKPFFYYQDRNFFAFASEKKGILAIPEVNRDINKQFLFNQMIFPPEQAVDTTLYEHIKRIPPAHTMIIYPNGKQELKNYWTLDAETELHYASRQDYYDGLLFHFQEAVKCRTRSNFPVATELSGGIDSSAITGVANRFMKSNGRELTTMSNTLPDGITDPEITKLDERKYIDEVIRFNEIGEAIYVTNKAFDTDLEEADFSLNVNDGLERWDPLWQIPLKQAAKQRGIRTLLSGFPGDELVTYRGKYHFLDYLDKKKYLKYFLAKKRYTDIHKLDPLVPHSVKYMMHRLKVYLHKYSHEATKQSFRIYNIPNKWRREYGESRWKDPLYQEQFKSYRYMQKYRILQPRVSQRLESETRYGIYYRTEPRFPMADIRLTQFYLTIPNEFKYEGIMSRSMFRNSLKKFLPSIVVERNDKYGSIAPFLALYSKNSQQTLDFLVKACQKNPFLNSEEILYRVHCASESISQSKKFNQREHAQKMLPALEIVRWIERNPLLL